MLVGTVLLASSLLPGGAPALRPHSAARATVRAQAFEPGHDDLYLVVGVPSSASGDELRRAYRSAAKALHPDVCPEPDAADRFQRLTAAYEILGNAEARANWDLATASSKAAVSGSQSAADRYFEAAESQRRQRQAAWQAAAPARRSVAKTSWSSAFGAVVGWGI